MSRRDELAANLAAVERRIQRACDAAGRRSDDVTLVVVTKTWPASDVRILADLGVREVAENRDQEAAAKAAELHDLPLHWHFVGQVQTNKARSVARYADVIQSVDRPKLVAALSRGAEAACRELHCLVQVNLDESDDAGEIGPRGGAHPEAAAAVADAIADAPFLTLGGVMAVAPRTGDPLKAFERLSAVAEHIRTAHPDATWISAGMSGDLEAAIGAGATHLRVGTAVFGSRPRLR